MGGAERPAGSTAEQQRQAGLAGRWSSINMPLAIPAAGGLLPVSQTLGFGG